MNQTVLDGNLTWTMDMPDQFKRKPTWQFSFHFARFSVKPESKCTVELHHQQRYHQRHPDDYGNRGGGGSSMLGTGERRHKKE